MFTVGLPSRMPDGLNGGTPLVFAPRSIKSLIKQRHASNGFCSITHGVRSHFYVSIDP